MSHSVRMSARISQCTNPADGGLRDGSGVGGRFAGFRTRNDLYKLIQFNADLKIRSPG